MGRRQMRHIVVVCALLGVQWSALSAELVLFDDFGDGSVVNDVPLDVNGNPVTWSPSDHSQLDAATGDLVLTSSAESVPVAFIDNLVMPDVVSLRSLVRLTMDGKIGLGSRGHWVLMDREGEVVFGRLGSDSPLVTVPTGLRPLETDVLMQLDVVDDVFRYWAWEPSKPFPSDPVLEISDPVLSDNRVMVGGITANYPGVTKFEAVFRFVQVADAPITDPPPPPPLAGDFNADGVLDVGDIDLLIAAIRSGNMNPAVDVDQSGLIDNQDLRYWVSNLKRTWLGDANLDGVFDSSDLIDVLAAGQFEDAIAGNSSWATGDWDGDGDFTTTDLVVALADGGFEFGPRAALHAVPEPVSFPSVLVLALAVNAKSRCSRILRQNAKPFRFLD